MSYSVFFLSLCLFSIAQAQYLYVIQNDCPSQFRFLESTLIKSNCDVPFPTTSPYSVNYTVPNPDGQDGDRSAALTTSGQCTGKTLFEGGYTPGSSVFLDISNIDGFTAGANVTGFYSDGTTRNIHCCSGCPNTTASPNCYGQGIYWFPTEIAGYGTTAWPFEGLEVLLLQWSCLSDADLHACDGVSCKNLGVCMGGMLGQCLCQPGWGGSDCSTKLDVTPCFGVNCGFYGVCNSTSAEAGGAKCACLQGWSGTLCTTPPAGSPCDGVNCGPQGICKNGLCECSNGFTGCNCEIVPNCTIVPSTNIAGNDLSTATVTSAEACCTSCGQTVSCSAWTWNGGTCYMKTSVGAGPVAANGNTSGYFPSTVTLSPESCLGNNGGNGNTGASGGGSSSPASRLQGIVASLLQL